MASTQTWSEGNGASGGTETASRADCNWKNVDDSTTAYSASPITAGNNSFWKYQAVKFGGTYNTLSAFTYKIDNNAPGTGLSIVGAPATTGATPATTASGDASLSTTGVTANFTGATWATAFAAGTATSTANPVYTQPLRTQLQTTTSAAPGDITSRTITASWTES